MSQAKLTENQIELVAESFAAVAPRGAALVARYYQRLFRDYPNVQPLFDSANQHYQQKDLLTSLVLLVENLQDGEVSSLEFEPPSSNHCFASHDEGDSPSERHQVYRTTLLKTLAEFVGDVWDGKLDEAWQAAYEAAWERSNPCSTVATAS